MSTCVVILVADVGVLFSALVAMTTLSTVGSLTCLAGTDLPVPSDCRRISSCGSHEKCSLEQYITPVGYIRYKASCKDTLNCGGVSMTDGTNTVICTECCDTDLCAASLCSAPGYPTTHGPICYHCNHAVEDPAHCDQIKVCDRNQVCSVHETPVAGVTKYSVRCLDLSPCHAVVHTGICATCCTSQLCNRHCTASTGSTTTVPPACQDDTTCQQLVTTFQAAHKDICTVPTMKYLCNNTCGLCSSIGPTVSTHTWSTAAATTTTTTATTTTTMTSPAYPCQPNPCQHGACAINRGSYTCSCNPGYIGHNCSIADLCTLALCLHGNCSNLSGGRFVCSCYPGYSGTLCDAVNGACATGPCLHGACTNTARGYHCNCHSGYLGTNCTTRNPCTMQPCRHGQCSSTSSGGFRCHCDPGYTGVLCDTDKNECNSNPCVHGQCVDKINDYSCICQSGFTGKNCDHASSACARNPCIHGACVDSGNGQYHCNCDPGYTDPNCFTDINDCQPSPCVHGQCQDGVNTYTCVCTPGYTGTQCHTVINECLPNPCHHGKCVHWTNGFICQCDMTYTGMTCDTKIQTRDCKDIKDLGMTSKDNVFTVKDATHSDLDIKCDMTTDGGGWTVLLYRDSNSVDFDHRDSSDYAVGFGDIRGDYWIGLENMHSLTSDGRQYQLRIELYDAGGHMYYEIYDDFRVDGRHEFRLHVGAGRGTAGDSLSNHTGYGFTTRDEDRDTDNGVNCAAYLHAGWWFHHCYDSCLTCPYLHPGTSNCASMSWNSLGYCIALSKAVMMVRPM